MSQDEKPESATSKEDEAPKSPSTQEPDKKHINKLEDLSTKEAYFASLNEWVKQANISQSAMALFPYYLFSSYPQMFQNQTTTGMGNGNSSSSAAPTQGSSALNGTAQQAVNRAGNGVGGVGAEVANVAHRRANILLVLSEQLQTQIINQNGGYEHVIAPFWKRALAELVDMFILLVLKIVITFTIMSIFDLDLGFDFDRELIRKSLEEDYAGFIAISTDFLIFSSDLLMLEILTKVIVCLYEAFCTRQSGATPGKMLLGIRIVYIEAMYALQPPQPPQLDLRPQRVQKALLWPAETPGFKRALMRSIAKNVLMTLLFPMCFIMIFFKNNRTAYDIITKTVVIEDNPNAVLQRPR